MRHLKSPLIGLGAAVGIWFGVAVGQRWSAGTVADWERSTAFHTAPLLLPTLLLLAAAVGAAALALPRVPPVVSLTAGLVLLAAQVALFVSPLVLQRALGAVSVGGETLPMATPVNNGTLLLVSVGLLCASAVPARWRRDATAAPPTAVPRAVGDAAPAPGDATAPALPLRRASGTHAYDRLGTADGTDAGRAGRDRPAWGAPGRGDSRPPRTAVFRREPAPRDDPAPDPARGATPDTAPATATAPPPAAGGDRVGTGLAAGDRAAGGRARRAGGGHREQAAPWRQLGSRLTTAMRGR